MTESLISETPLMIMESPQAPEEPHTREIRIGGSVDMYGACSIETFNSANSLSSTHEDARGWLDYATQFTPANFWYGDGNVKVWMYEQPNDNFQDTYGADAVLAFYHAGHGIMDSNGVFYAAMGGSWDNRDNAASNRMVLGNDQAKYLFWSTCFSLRVLGQHTPIRTWHGSNAGLRMIFGFETVSVDNPNYGRYFWEEWNNGKSFSQAWLDASWRIEQGQIASVCACASTQELARESLYNERAFNRADPGKAWYQWRWTDAGSNRSANPSTGIFPIPSKLLIAEFEPINWNRQQEIAVNLADAFNIGNKKHAVLNSFGNYNFRNGSSSLTLNKKDNSFDIVLAKPNIENSRQIDTNRAQKIAENLIQDFDLTKGMDIELYDVRYDFACGGSPKGSGTLEEPRIIGTTLEFRQFINGVPAVNRDGGNLRVTVDNDGKVTHVRNSVRSISNLSDKPKSASVAPPDPSIRNTRSLGESDIPSMDDLEVVFQEKLDKLFGHEGGNSRDISNSKKVLSTDIGYDMSKSHGGIIATRLYEVDMGNGFQKLYRINAPIFE